MYASTAEQRSRERVQVLAEQLYRKRYPHLFRIALKNAANHDDAEEAVNEAFASFLRAFDPTGEAPPLAWLALALKRECWAKYRHEHFDRRSEKQPEVDFGKPGLSIESNRTSAAGPQEADRTGRARSRGPRQARRPEARRAPHHRPDRGRLLLPRGRPDHRLVLHQDQPLRQRGPGGPAQRHGPRLKSSSMKQTQAVVAVVDVEHALSGRRD